jgi:nitrogen fixation-related uncharacterized protein
MNVSLIYLIMNLLFVYLLLLLYFSATEAEQFEDLKRGY